MPEGPECKAYADAINASFQNSPIQDIKIISGRYTRGAPTGFDLALNTLPNNLIKVNVKGKFLYFELKDGTYIWNTLGMTGGWSDSIDDYTRLSFKFSNGNLHFSDARNFGTFHFNKTLSETKEKLKSLGIDFLNENGHSYDLSYYIFNKNKNKTLAEILMNQKNYAGVGNYIKSEVLYRAKLSPHKLGKDCSAEEIKILHDTINLVINSSYNSRDMELVPYKDLTSPNFEIFKKIVYRREKDPFGNPVIAEETKDKRTTYWVPAVQL